MNGKTNASDVTVNQIVNGVLIPLEPATDFKIGSGSGRAYFSWTDPVDKYTTPGDELVSQWEKSVVVRKKDSAPSNIDDGTVVLTETVRNQYQTSQYVDESVEDDTTYYYSVYPVTTTNMVSDPAGGVAVIPMGGEPGFKTKVDNLFTVSTNRDGDTAYISGGSNDTVTVMQEFYPNYPGLSTSNLHAIDLDLTYHALGGFATDTDQEEPAIGEMDKYVILTEGRITGGSDSTGHARYTNAFDRDMVKNSLSPTLTGGLGMAVSSPDRSSVMFAGGTGFQQYGTNRAEVIHDTLTIQDIGAIKNTSHYGPYSLAGTHVGNHYIYGYGEDNDDNYYYINTSMYVWNDDYTKISGVHDASEASIHEGYAYQVDRYAIFWGGGYDEYFETWDSDLTFTPYTSYQATIDALRNQYQAYSAIRYHKAGIPVNRQYGNYAMVPSGDTMSGTEMMMIDSDLSISIKKLDEFESGASNTYDSVLAILDKMYILYNKNYRSGIVSLFVLTI